MQVDLGASSKAVSLALVVFGTVMLIVLSQLAPAGGSRSSAASIERASSVSGLADSEIPSSTPRADAFSSSTGTHMDAREKQLYENDPSSMGYTDSDREFLREHGLSESEARAAETILQQHGIE